MAGNSIGKEFIVTTFGESHGKVVGVVVDGCPAGLPLSEADFQVELDRRIPAEPKIVSARVEKDVAKILSGIFNGFTTGAPIAVMVENKETRLQRLRSHERSAKTRALRLPSPYQVRRLKRLPRRRTLLRQSHSSTNNGWTIAKKLLSRFDIDVLAYTSVDWAKLKLTKSLALTEIRKNRNASRNKMPRLSLRRKDGGSHSRTPKRRRKSWRNNRMYRT